MEYVLGKNGICNDEKLKDQCRNCMTQFYHLVKSNPRVLAYRHAGNTRSSKWAIEHFRNLSKPKFWNITQDFNTVLAIYIDGKIKYYKISQNVFITSKSVHEKSKCLLLKDKKQIIEITSYDPDKVYKPQSIDKSYIALITAREWTKKPKSKRNRKYHRITDDRNVMQPAIRQMIPLNIKRYPFIILSHNDQSATIEKGIFIHILCLISLQSRQLYKIIYFSRSNDTFYEVD